MAISFDDLKVQAIPRLNGCPNPIIIQRLYWAARRFFMRSEVWTYDQTQDVVADQTDYTLSLPVGSTNATIKRLKLVWYGEDSADKQSHDRVGNADYEFEPEVTLAFLTAYTQAITNGLTTQIVLYPDLANHEVPNRMMDEWGLRGILECALWNLKRDRDRPWSDPDGAKDHENMYSRALAEARAQTATKRKGGDLRVVARKFV